MNTGFYLTLKTFRRTFFAILVMGLLALALWQPASAAGRSNAALNAQARQGDDAVATVTFAAKAQNKAAVLSWHTGLQMNYLGFNIWRQSDNGTWTRVNSTLLPLHNQGAINGAAYRYTDKNVKVGKTYAYKLEIVELSSMHQWSMIAKVKIK